MYKDIKHIGLQFFAEPAGSEGNNGGSGEGAAAGAEGTPAEGTPKTFTQDQMNAVAAREKQSARNAILRELGYEVPQGGDYQDQVKAIKAILDSGKTEQQKDKEAKERAESDLTAERTRANSLQNKIDAMTAGVKPEFVDDAISLLAGKVTNEKTLAKLLEEYKPKYPNWFGESGGSKGTGSPINPPKKGGEVSGMGKRLAQTGKPQAKSSYFKN